MKKLLTRFKKDQRGLTLVELLAVVVILAIVSAIAFVVIGKVIDNSKEDAHIANAQQVISAVKLAEASGEIKSSDLEQTGGLNVLAEKNKIETIGSLVDPWAKPTTYTTANVTKTTDNKYSITLSATEADKKCKIEGVSEDKLQEGRKEVCKKTP